MGAGALNVFIDLVGADPRYGLGDGEAATIALADSLSVAAVLDDRKASRVAGERFAHLTVYSTLDLLSRPQVVDALGMTRLAEAVFDALRYARMRVPHRFDGWVRELIGPERAAQCPSLKRR
jgi:predicted nucleic acid-binding protein